MDVYHTLGNLLILPLNTLHLFLYLDPKRGRPAVFALGVALLLLPWLAGYYGYLDRPTPAWLLPSVLVSPAICLPIFRYCLMEAGWRRLVMAIGFVVTFSYAAMLLARVVTDACFPPETARWAILPAQLLLYAILFPLLYRYTRAPIRRAMDAMEGERWHFLILVPMVLILGQSIVGVLYAAPGTALPASALMPLLATAVFYAQLYYFMAMRKRYWRVEHALEAAEKRLPMYEGYARELARREAELAAQRHDFRHVLGQLAVRAREEGAAPTAERIRAFLGTEGELAARRYSANAALNAVVSYYFAQAEANGTRCEADLSVPEALPLTDAELAMLAGNALENAVKATRPLGAEGWLRMSARTTKDCLVLKFVNNRRAGQYERGQGLGLPGIRLLCERYEGIMEKEEDAETFELTLALPLTPPRDGQGRDA